MQKIRKKFERCKAQKRFANRVTPWDTAGNAVCLRDGQDVQLPHNVLESPDQHTCVTLSLCGLQLACDRGANTERSQIDKVNQADELRKAPHVAKHVSGANVDCPDTVDPSLCARDGAVRAAAADSSWLPQNSVSALLPYFRHHDLVLHANALSSWVEQQSATCAAAVVSTAWNVLCGKPGASPLQTKSMSGDQESPTGQKHGPCGSLPTPHSTLPSPEIKLLDSQVPHDMQTGSSHCASITATAVFTGALQRVSHHDVLQIYADQQQRKVRNPRRVACTIYRLNWHRTRPLIGLCSHLFGFVEFMFGHGLSASYSYGGSHVGDPTSLVWATTCRILSDTPTACFPSGRHTRHKQLLSISAQRDNAEMHRRSAVVVTR